MIRATTAPPFAVSVRSRLGQVARPGFNDRFLAVPSGDLHLTRLPITPRVARPTDPPPLPATSIPMTVLREAGCGITRLYLPIQLEGGAAASIMVDSGTARTWVHMDGEGGPEFVESAFTARLGGQQMMLWGRHASMFGETNGALPVIGAVGNDYLLAGTTILDFSKGTLTRCPAASRVPGSEKWPSMPFKESKGVITVDVHLDGQMRHLLLDTGAPASILLGQAGTEGDAERPSYDVHGNPLQARVSRATLQLPGVAPRLVPLWRMQTFPHLECIGTALGQPLDGLLGLSSLGDKRVILDGATNRVLVEP